MQEDGFLLSPLLWQNKAVKLNIANQGELVKIHFIA